MSEEQQIGLGISKIRELAFSIETLDKLPEQLELGFGIHVEFEPTANTFDLQVIAELKETETQKVLVHIKVANVFLIENMGGFYKAETKSLNLPDDALITMLSISVTHTRALFAKNTAGTIYENHIIPIINPTDMAKEVFKMK
jgi:hypothetical protein